MTLPYCEAEADEDSQVDYPKLWVDDLQTVYPMMSMDLSRWNPVVDEDLEGEVVVTKSEVMS